MRSESDQPDGASVQRPGRLTRVTDALAVFGAVTFGVTALVGVVISLVALRRADPSDGLGRREATSALVGSALALVVMLVVDLLAGSVLLRAGGVSADANCQSNLHDLGRSLAMYADDNGGCLPLRGNWCDVLKRYNRSQLVYQCPGARRRRCDYTYSAALSEVGVKDVALPAQTAMVFDGTGGWNSSGGPAQMAHRHRGHANACFADGAVRHVRGETVELPLVWYPVTSFARGTPR